MSLHLHPGAPASSSSLPALTTHRWTLTYRTARIGRGVAATRREAELAVAQEEALRVARGLDPDGLAWWVDEVRA